MLPNRVKALSCCNLLKVAHWTSILFTGFSRLHLNYKHDGDDRVIINYTSFGHTYTKLSFILRNTIRLPPK